MEKNCWSPFTADRSPSRWAILAASLSFMCLGGTVYAFGIFSEPLKERLDLSQHELDIIATVGRFGVATGIIPGLFNDRYGVTISIWVALGVITLGWTLMTLFVTQTVDLHDVPNSYLIVSIANYTFLHGNAWFTTIAGPTIAQNFPKKDHGKLLGLAKGYLGLGSAFMAIWKTQLANNDVDVFMFEYLVFLPIFGLICGWFLRNLPKNIATKYTLNGDLNANGSVNFTSWYGAATCFALFCGTLSVVQNLFDLPKIEIAVFIVAMLIWMLPWLLAAVFYKPFLINTDNVSLIENEMQNAYNNQANESVQSLTDHTNDAKLPAILCTIEFWLLYIPFVIIAGAGLVFIDNIAQIIESASSTATKEDRNSEIATSLVTMISVGSFLGRVVVGFLADLYRHKFHKVFWMMLSCVCMALSTLMVYFIGTNVYLFFIAGFCVGFSYGWIYTVVITSCSDLWGTRYLSSNYAALDSAQVFGQLIFSNLVFANLYEEAGRPINGDHTKCWGDACYKNTFLIVPCACLVAFGMTFALWIIVKKKANKTGQPMAINETIAVNDVTMAQYDTFNPPQKSPTTSNDV